MQLHLSLNAPFSHPHSPSRTDHMQSVCKNHFLQQLYRKIEGAVIWSQNERNLDCIVTFQTHSILQRFMLRFDMLQLDCNDHLYVYDGAHAVGAHKVRTCIVAEGASFQSVDIQRLEDFRIRIENVYEHIL